MNHISIFSWGFWGWGTATSRLVEAVDAAERRRGFNPPLFVDIRFQRTGRAPGFKGDAFEKLLGWRRYRWMRTLGNSSIGTRRAPRIACPAAADQLLELALDAADRSSRVIFFCACESPGQSLSCHRHMVKKLLSRAASRRHLSVGVTEWPGGSPSPRPLTMRVSSETLKAAVRGSKAIALSMKRVPTELVGLPWGTLVVLKAGTEKFPVAVGLAAYRLGRWVLPRFQDSDYDAVAQDLPSLRREATRLRGRYGLD
jgi:hypothetical protein